MSIRQKRTMTRKSLEAHRRNARRSRGPVTEKGKKHSRDANICHGFYSQDGGTALEVLGEDPGEYQSLAEAVAKKWQPADAYEEQLGTRLVRALWRSQRSDRMQEGLALRLAQEAGRWRQDNLHARLTKLCLNAQCLLSLAKEVGQRGYVTTPSDMEMLRSFQADGVLKDMGGVIMDLLIVLQHPEDPSSVPVGGAPDAAAPAQAAEPPIPGVAQAPESAPDEEGAGRRDWRLALQNILHRQAELLEEQRTACLQEFITGPSPFERAAEFSSAYSEMKLLQRVEDSNFRQVWRITDLFMKLKGGAPEQKKAGRKMPPQGSDTPSAPAMAVEQPEMAPETPPMTLPLSPPPGAPERDPEPPPSPATAIEPGEPGENEGASGKVPSNQ